MHRSRSRSSWFALLTVLIVAGVSLPDDSAGERPASAIGAASSFGPFVAAALPTAATVFARNGATSGR